MEKEQIQKEIDGLKEIKPKVRHFTLFGDDNHKAIEVQIKVLQNELSEDDIWNRFEDNDHLRDAGLYACDWLLGDTEEGLVDSWKSLVEEE